MIVQYDHPLTNPPTLPCSGASCACVCAVQPLVAAISPGHKVIGRPSQPREFRYRSGSISTASVRKMCYTIAAAAAAIVAVVFAGAVRSFVEPLTYLFILWGFGLGANGADTTRGAGVRGQFLLGNGISMSNEERKKWKHYLQSIPTNNDRPTNHISHRFESLNCWGLPWNCKDL